MGAKFTGLINLSKIDKTRIFKNLTNDFLINVEVEILDKPDRYGNTISISQPGSQYLKKVFIGDAKSKDPKVTFMDQALLPYDEEKDKGKIGF